MRHATDALSQTGFIQQLDEMGFDPADIREVLVAGLYRNDRITFRQSQKLLNLKTLGETAKVLKEHGCVLSYDGDEFKRDVEKLDVFFSERKRLDQSARRGRTLTPHSRPVGVA